MSDESYVRRCSNWIQSFKDWTLDRSEAAESLIEWSAIWTLATALERRIFIPKSLLGSWSCYPYLYTMVVGPSGIRKTTTLRYSFDLLAQVPNFPKPPNFVTVEGLIDDLVKAPNNATYLVVEEFGDLLIKNTPDKLYGFLTSMYDGKADIRQKTLSRDLEYANKPCLNVFAGTTSEWIADNIPINSLNGGFGSRWIWVYINKLRRKRMYYKEEYKNKDYFKLEQDLVLDLIHIATKLEGEYLIDDETLKWMEQWYQEMEDKVTYKKVAGYIMRKHVYVHKLAMIFHVAYSDTNILNTLDFQNAINLMEAIEPQLPKIFGGLGKNVYAVEMRDIALEVAQNPGITEADLRAEFQAAAEPSKLTELIEGLLQAGVLRSQFDDNNKRVLFLKDEEVD